MSHDRPHRGGRRRGGGHGGRGGGGGGGHGDDRWEHDGFAASESPDVRLRNAVVKLGDADPVPDIPRLAQDILGEKAAKPETLAEGFRIGVTEQPFKIPFYASLLRHLYNAPEDTDGPALGAQILDHFAQGFRAFLDRLAWRETRLCVHFFAHLTVAGVITVSSMSALLQSFIAVLDEVGSSQRRSRQSALCAAEGLMRAGPILVGDDSTTAPLEMINTLQTYADSLASSKDLVQPFIHLHSAAPTLENVDEILDSALAALRTLAASNFAETTDAYAQLYVEFAPLPESQAPFELPAILVPTEVLEFDAATGEDGDGATATAGPGAGAKEEWSEFYVRLFDNDVTPDPSTPAGYAVRAELLDTVDIFEVNRKECARILLEYPKWTPPGTFRPRPGEGADAEAAPGKDWQLESTLVETVLGAALLLPDPAHGHKSLYYATLLTELCKAAPTTVGPAVGKAIRRLFTMLENGLDSELSRRFAEWFALHMSNFNFQWVWKEWVPDLTLALLHPKRVFMRRAIDFEIRLAYYDRIMKTLPDAFRDPQEKAVPEQAPGPNFEYDEPTHPHHDFAAALLDDLRSRKQPDDVLAHLETLKAGLQEADGLSGTDADALARRAGTQALLHIGARSFSHFLNAVERYLPLLRALAAGGPPARQGVLAAAGAFWATSPQMVGIVFDKLMQYQVAEPADVVAWAFAAHLAPERWDVLRAALDKAHGRVVVARRRIAALRKEEDERRAKALADAAAMDVDAEAKPDEAPVEESPALATALKALASLTREQRAALSAALGAFVDALATAPANDIILTEKAWHNRANWGDDEWATWSIWAWYKHFCRLYSPYLRTYANTLSTVAFVKLEGKSDPAAELLKRWWSVAIMEA